MGRQKFQSDSRPNPDAVLRRGEQGLMGFGEQQQKL